MKLKAHESVKTEIVLCPECKGRGYITEDYCTDYHKREYDTRYYDCKICLNSGRVKTKTTITIEPYEPKRIDR